MTLEERQIEQEKVVAVLTSNHEDMKEDIADLKQGQKDLSDKMDTGLGIPVEVLLQEENLAYLGWLETTSEL